MKALWRRLGRSHRTVRAKPQRATVREKFAALRTIGATNDAFLNGLAYYQNRLEAGMPPHAGIVAEAYEATSTPVRAMVRALLAMGEGRYPDLERRYETLDRELAMEVLRARPIEFGPLVAWPGDAIAIRPEVVGPKAARLAELAADSSFAVPPFFAVTVHGFRLFMEATGVYERLQGYLALENLADDAAMKSFAARAAAAVLEASLPAQLGAAIGQALQTLHRHAGREVMVAVRSSAVVEDADSSFAGQFESVLNVPASEVPQAYQRVIASKYRAEALRYAIGRGFLDEDVAMPVLVMAMVRPDASGVAYSRSPDARDRIMVTAVPGLGQTIVEGSVIPDYYELADGQPARVEKEVPGRRSVTLRCADAGGVEEFQEGPAAPAAMALSRIGASRVAMLCRSLERRFGQPQDMEWALDGEGLLWILQTRPLNLAPASEKQEPSPAALAGYRVLLHGGMRASGGVAAGRVAVRTDLRQLGPLPDECILVVPKTSPRLAGLLGSLAGLVTAAGSATGHMATVAREFGVPCLVGAEDALTSLPEGMLVTLDADRGKVYEGMVPVLLAGVERSAAAKVRRDPVRESLQRLVERVAPLTLTDPDSPDFDPPHCRTLHDIARFVHQRGMIEMFAIDSLALRERRGCRRLVWPNSMEVLVLDLGGGVAPTAGRQVRADEITSVPLQALVEGMTDSRLRCAGPVGFDLKGFVSVVVRSAADDQRYGEPSYALCSRDYAHFASRLAYHFAIVDAICGDSVNENYARFRFQGGAAVAQRREWRASFLGAVLHENEFTVRQVGDRVEASLTKRTAGEIEDALVMLGRLMMASRQLDMVIESPAVAAALARAFLSGDYGFEQVRRESV